VSHIFISYSHKDTDYAHALAENLQSLGFDVWIDERLDYGSQWPQELQKRLDTCSAFILIMSPRSYTSEWVQSELQRAKRKSKPVFPLLLEGDEPWLAVESTQYFDVRGDVLPDSKFYSAVKNVITPTPRAATLQRPKKQMKAEGGSGSFEIGSGVRIIAITLVLLTFAGGAILVLLQLTDRMNATQPTAVPTHAEAQLSQPTSAPEETAAVEDTQTPQETQLPVAGGDNMALVPAGPFTMGGKASEEVKMCSEKFGSVCQLAWFVDEEPEHQVSLAAFFIDIYEVTNAGYKDCVQQGACEPPQSSASNSRPSYYGDPEFDQYPVIYVSWHQAQAYCKWRGARLPTEAEWEKAARGTDLRMYPWGNELDATFANFHWSVSDTTPVGSYESGISPYGLYDMAGNVWEWTSSLYKPYPYNTNDGRESATGSGDRVIRGGSWGQEGDNSVSVSYRYAYDPDQANMDLGFRCAKDTNP
jgi:formylglycine-generating enzyme required for sulfatase activity